MELKLVVLAGAKVGTEIPLKKDEFVIGRAKECTLRAASEAISRRHCAITRGAEGWSIRDLGSRNGTYVNDVRIEAATPLAAGNELRVGPLKFRVDARQAPAQPAKRTDIPRGKQSAVKDVTDVAQRSAGKSDADTTEEDISRWLLGVPESKPGDALKETRTIRMEETTTMNRAAARPAQAGEPAASPDEDDEVAAENGKADEADEAEKGGRWGWMKGGKNVAKKKPGKLPPRQAEQSSKDSREAAADILREMTRRR
ncbi:MAG: FHA domain-containing protein [Pirellulales bacterium]